MIDKWQS